MPNRNPVQLTELPKFGGPDTVSIQPFAQLKDKGVDAFSLSLKPNAKAAAPDPSQSSGQYLVITRGSTIYQGKEYKAITVAHIKPEEKQFQLVAGSAGLDAVVLNFPRVMATLTKAPGTAKNGGYRVWQCLLCAFEYDEVVGMPDEGIAAGTRWEDVPQTWTCPDCAANKNDFEMAVVG